MDEKLKALIEKAYMEAEFISDFEPKNEYNVFETGFLKAWNTRTSDFQAKHKKLREVLEEVQEGLIHQNGIRAMRLGTLVEQTLKGDE